MFQQLGRLMLIVALAMAALGGVLWGLGKLGIGRLPGDLNDDGDVDLGDLAGLLGAYGTCEGDPNYNPTADFDDNGCVDLWDLLTLLDNYGVGA